MSQSLEQASVPSSPPAARGTISSTLITVVANIVGAGLLSLPYTIATAGVVPGVLALLATGVLNCLSAILLARSCSLSGAGTYMELVGRVFGPGWQRWVTLLLAVYTLGSGASYVVVLGDQLPSLLSLVGVRGLLARQELLLPLVGVGVLYPLCLLRDLSSLRLTSSGSFACILFCSLLIVAKAVQGPLAAPQYIVPLKAGSGVFVGLPIALVSFTCHYNVPKFWSEFAPSGPPERKLPLFCAILLLCFLIVAACYESVAVCGYLLFGSPVHGNPSPVNPKGDILLDFGTADAAVVVARFALVVTQVLNFPIVFNSHRASVIGLLPLSWQRRCQGLQGSSSAGSSEGSEGAVRAEAAPLLEEAGQEGEGGSGLAEAAGSSARSWGQWVHAEGPHWAITALLIALTVGFAVAVPNLSIILGIKGALGATLIVYAIPAALYFALRRQQLAGGEGGKQLEGGGQQGWAQDLWSTSHGMLCLALCLWALVVMVLGVLNTFKLLG